MKVFADYSKYYDLIYTHKNYSLEADFVASLIKEYQENQVHSILELGTGTGRHAALLAKKGYDICGVDFSATMLEMAGKLCAQDPMLAKKIQLHHADVRTFSIDKTFDTSIALFHVLSYQTTNEDVEATFRTVKKHVKKGGLFIFDCWYGPAVFCAQPEVRFKAFENDELCVHRVAVPTLSENLNTVNVHYHIYAKEKQSSSFEHMEENHLMRYFFLPEIEQLCAKFDMSLVHSCEWVTRQPLSQHSWGACFVVKL